jgi:predicted enzyme related to lactoylglutathione lyase
MPEFTKHEQGSFSWAELATTDTKAAKAFYTALFGWSVLDSPMGPGPEDIYTRLQLGGKDVGALYPMRPEQRQQGVPPNWGTYFTVSKVDDTTRKVKPAGGNVLTEPFDVMEYGRMSVVQGPEGAVFCLWQAGTHIGFQRMNEDNTAGWTELQTSDATKSGKFLVDVLGFALKTDPNGAYTELQRGGQSIGGIRPLGAGEALPPHWLIYFMVADCDAAVKKAQSLGANVLMPSMDIEKVGRFAVVADPVGAVFAVIKLSAAM